MSSPSSPNDQVDEEAPTQFLAQDVDPEAQTQAPDLPGHRGMDIDPEAQTQVPDFYSLAGPAEVDPTAPTQPYFGKKTPPMESFSEGYFPILASLLKSFSNTGLESQNKHLGQGFSIIKPM